MAMKQNCEYLIREHRCCCSTSACEDQCEAMIEEANRPLSVSCYVCKTVYRGKGHTYPDGILYYELCDDCRSKVTGESFEKTIFVPPNDDTPSCFLCDRFYIRKRTREGYMLCDTCSEDFKP